MWALAVGLSAGWLAWALVVASAAAAMWDLTVGLSARALVWAGSAATLAQFWVVTLALAGQAAVALDCRRELDVRSGAALTEQASGLVADPAQRSAAPGQERASPVLKRAQVLPMVSQPPR